MDDIFASLTRGMGSSSDGLTMPAAATRELEVHANRARKPMARIEEMVREIPMDAEVAGRLLPRIAEARNMVENAADLIVAAMQEGVTDDPLEPLHRTLRQIGDQCDALGHDYPEFSEAGKATRGIVSAVREIASVLNSDEIEDIIGRHMEGAP